MWIIEAFCPRLGGADFEFRICVPVAFSRAGALNAQFSIPAIRQARRLPHKGSGSCCGAAGSPAHDHRRGSGCRIHDRLVWWKGI
jgi:hypothetical protein